MTLSTPTRQEALWTTALNCALHGQKKSCKNEWDSPVCSKCKYYIKNYIYCSPSQAKLYMLQAESSAGMITATGNGHRVVFTVIIIFSVLMAWANYACGQKTYYALDNVKKNVLSTNKYIRQNLRDINNDGETDCEDYAILFYKYYPLSEVKILSNRSEVHNFYHAFNAVKVEGEWRAVEPQSISNSPIWMEQYWSPKKYDPKLNEDYTSFYKNYAGKQTIHSDTSWMLWVYIIGIVLGIWFLTGLHTVIFINKGRWG